MVVVVANGLQLDGTGSVESCFAVLHHHLARTGPQTARYQGGFFGDQELCMVMESGFWLDEMGSSSQIWCWPLAHTLPRTRSRLYHGLCGDQACGMEMEKGF